MTAPLYDHIQENKPEIGVDGNRGLWFERFYDQYDPRNWEVLKPSTNNSQMGNSYWLLKYFNKKVGDSNALERHVQTQIQLTKNLNGQSHAYHSSWHFVTGMGNPHPVENGFAWHPTLGVPYLTGAAVKGLVRTYIENYLDLEESTNPDKKQLLLQWFGSTDKDPQSAGYESQAGKLVFFDALPTTPVSLGVDVMTPHMGKWYEKGGTDGSTGAPEAVPADWHDPVPVSFLVAKDITLLFSFAIRENSSLAEDEQEHIDLKDVADVLQRALEHEGAGSKTATGYGGMQQASGVLDKLNKSVVEAEQNRLEKALQEAQRAERESALKQMNPIEREVAEFATVVDALNALKGDKWIDEERQQAAMYLKQRMQSSTEKNDKWKEQSEGKNPRKDKAYQRTLQVMEYL